MLRHGADFLGALERVVQHFGHRSLAFRLLAAVEVLLWLAAVHLVEVGELLLLLVEIERLGRGKFEGVLVPVPELVRFRGVGRALRHVADVPRDVVRDAVERRSGGFERRADGDDGLFEFVRPADEFFALAEELGGHDDREDRENEDDDVEDFKQRAHGGNPGVWRGEGFVPVRFRSIPQTRAKCNRKIGRFRSVRFRPRPGRNDGATDRPGPVRAWGGSCGPP